MLANLIAASIIYLGAAAAGLVPVSFWLLALSIALATAGIGLYFVLVFGIQAWASKRGIAREVTAVAATVVALMTLALWIWQPEPRQPGAGGAVIGFSVIAVGAIVYAVISRKDQRPSEVEYEPESGS